MRDYLDRPEPSTLPQGAINACTNPHATTAFQSDPPRVNTTAVKVGKPALGVRGEWIRFALRRLAFLRSGNA